MAIVYDDDPKKKSRIVYDDEPAKQEPITQPLQDVGARMAERVRSAASAESIPEYLLQTAGNAAASLGDIGIGAASTLGKAYGKIDPRGAEAAKTAGSLALGKLGGAFRAPLLEKAGAALHQSPIGQGLDKIAGNERVMKNLGAGANLASLIPAERVVAPALRAATKGALGTVQKAAETTVSMPSKLGEGLQNAAARIQGTKVKVLTPEMKKGASNAQYKKYGVFGNAEQVQKQWHGKIQDLATQLKEKINSVEFDPNNPETRINLVQVINRAKQKTLEGSRINKNALSKVADDVANELETTYGLDFNKAPAISNNVDLAESQLLKQEVGKHGDWLSHNGKIAANQDATNKAAFYNTLYNELKVELENKGPEGIKQLNKQLSEIIPMERSAAKQVLVQNRKNPLSLDDYIGGLATAGSALHGNLFPAAVAIGNAASKSPNVAKGMYKLGKLMKGESGIVGSLKSERGSIGGGYDYVGTPAIRDPATGKIYTGDWRGHKGALTKAGDEEIEKRLRYEHFLDNTNKPTDNVGFIDKKGNFISRTEAEKMLQPKSSLSQMFHDEGFVGSRSETGNAAFDKFMGKEISPQYQALLKDPKTIEEMRTTLERLAPAERSAMVERLKKIYGPQWSEYGPLFGTLGIGAVGTGGGITAYEMARNKK
jgi:hypothetical protein